MINERKRKHMIVSHIAIFRSLSLAKQLDYNLSALVTERVSTQGVWTSPCDLRWYRSSPSSDVKYLLGKSLNVLFLSYFIPCEANSKGI